MKTNFLTGLIAVVATTCCMSFANNYSASKLKQAYSPIVVDGYYVDGNVTVHIECTTSGLIANVRIVDTNNNELTVTDHNGSASVSSGIITLTNFTADFKWEDGSDGITNYSGELTPE